MSVSDSFEVRVPGKIMLAGEYAVLRGGASVAATLDGFLSVELANKPENASEEPTFRISSDLWTSAKTLSAKEASPSTDETLLSTVFDCMKTYDINSGTLDIKSDLLPSYGIGSSSALRLGVILGFDALKFGESELKQKPRGWDLVRRGYELQKKAQGLASGYDLATQFLGGLVLMHPPENDHHWPGSVTRLCAYTDVLNTYIHPFVGGQGAPTGKTSRSTMNWLEDTAKFSELELVSKALVDALTEFFMEAKSHEKLQHLFSAVAKHRRFFQEAPSYPKALCKELASLPDVDETWSFKTTGAGGEDALILIGLDENLSAAKAKLAQLGWKPLPFRFANESIQIKRGKKS